MDYKVKTRKPVHGMCPPGYEKVKAYRKKSGEGVEEHCRKIKARGRVRAGLSGLYNETMIAQEDARLGFDSIVDSTHSGERTAEKMKFRAKRVEDIMREQEHRKEEGRREEEKKK